MRDKIDSLIETILKFNCLISLIITISIIWIFKDNLIEIFGNQKSEILNMIISLSGTLFGFILTFLSIFIVFKTDTKYEKTEDNKVKPIIMLVNNNSFNDIYKLFIKASSSLGVLILIAILYYFTTYGLNYVINFIFICLIIFLIIVCIVRVLLSLYLFNILIKILVKSK